MLRLDPFRLEQQIDAWCERVLEGQCGARERREELRDHLASDIERLVAEGASEEEAFRDATRRMGSVEELSKEYRKNASLLATLAHAGSGHDDDHGDHDGGEEPMNAAKVGVIMLLQSVIWAVVMIATARLVEGPAGGEGISSLLVAGWFASTMLLTVLVDYRRAIKAECAFFRRLFRIGRSSPAG